jgi:hypothetical protein
MGFLDKLLGRNKPAEQPQSAPEPPTMPAADTGGEHAEGEHDHSHEGEHDHDH